MHLRPVLCLVFLLSYGHVYCQDEAPIVADPATGDETPDVLPPPEPLTEPEGPAADPTTAPDTGELTPPAINETTSTPVTEETTASTGTPLVAPDAPTDAPSADVADAITPVVTDAPLVVNTSTTPADELTGDEVISPAPMGPNGEVLGLIDPGTHTAVSADPMVVSAPNTTETIPTNTTKPENGTIVPFVGDSGAGVGVAGSGLVTGSPAGEGDALGTGEESATGAVSTDSSNSTSQPAVAVVVPRATTSRSGPILLPGETAASTITPTTTKATTTAKRAEVKSVEGWWKKGSLLAAGIILLILIVLGYIYACCCIKSPATSERRRSIHRGNIEDGSPDTEPIVRPIEGLTKSNKYVDEMITNASYHHQETRRERDVFLGTNKADLSTPNNSFTSPEDVTAVENQNSKFSKMPVIGKPTGITIPIGTPINSPAPTSAPATHFKYAPPRGPDKSFVHTAPTPWDRRLDAPPNTAPITSRDVINASRVNNAVVTVAAAGATPVRNGEGERPVLRGATLPAGGSAPSRPPSYRTTLLITPVHNADPDVQLPPGEVLPYKRYVESIKGRNSDFAQYSPEYNREMAELERRNVESQL